MKKKILYLDLPLESPGGGQFSLRLILQNLNKQKFLPMVFIPYKNQCTNWFDEDNISYKIVPIYNLFWDIKKEKPNLIHCNSAATKYTFIASLAAKILSIPFIWHVRVTDSAGWKDKVIAKLSTKIIAISEAVKNIRFSWLKNNNKIEVVYNTVDLNIFKPGLPTSQFYQEFNIDNNIDKDKKLVGIFSRLDAWKGHKLFFQAAKLVNNKFKNTVFLVIGTGAKAYEQELLNLVKSLNISDNVMFLGFRKDIPELMNLCDIIVNPSIEPEPFGRTIIESMACKVPVVATNMGGPKEIIENEIDGFLVEPKKEALANAIIKLLDDELFAKSIVNKAYKKVMDNFSIPIHIKKIENVYA